MTTKTKRRLLTGGAALGILLGLFFAYRSYAAAARMANARQVFAEMRNLPPEQGKAAREKMRVAMNSLTPEQRRQVFEEGFEQRMKDFFKLSQKDRNAILDNMIKRDLNRRANTKNANNNRNTTKNGNTTKGGNNANNNNANNANNNNRNQGQGQGQGRQNLSPEQRAQQRRARLDQTSPEQRGMRAAMREAIRTRRAQLGLPPSSGRGGR